MKLVLAFSFLVLLAGLAGCCARAVSHGGGSQFPPAQNEGEHPN